MAEMMSDDEFIKTVSKEELFDSWSAESERRKKLQEEVRILKERVKHYEVEADKFERWYRRNQAIIDKTKEGLS